MKNYTILKLLEYKPPIYWVDYCLKVVEQSIKLNYPKKLIELLDESLEDVENIKTWPDAYEQFHKWFFKVTRNKKMDVCFRNGKKLKYNSIVYMHPSMKYTTSFMKLTVQSKCVDKKETLIYTDISSKRDLCSITFVHNNKQVKIEEEDLTGEGNR
jgi:hypothetical protein